MGYGGGAYGGGDDGGGEGGSVPTPSGAGQELMSTGNTSGDYGWTYLPEYLATQTANYSLGASVDTNVLYVPVNSTAGSFTVTFPATPRVGQFIFLADVGATSSVTGVAANHVAVDGNGKAVQDPHTGLFAGAYTIGALAGDAGGTTLGWVYATEGHWKAVSTPPTAHYTPPDANTYLQWILNEAASPYLNTGAGPALPLTPGSGLPVPGVDGVYESGVAFQGVSSYLSSGATAVHPAVATALTVDLWVFLTAYSANQFIFCKNYAPAAGPFSIYMGQNSALSGAWYGGIAVAGSSVGFAVTDAWNEIPLYTWTNLAFTYDGQNIYPYLNGIPDAPTAAPGVIDWGTGGAYQVGGTSLSSAYLNGIVNVVRVEGVQRSQSYLRNKYLRQMGRTNTP